MCQGVGVLGRLTRNDLPVPLPYRVLALWRAATRMVCVAVCSAECQCDTCLLAAADTLPVSCVMFLRRCCRVRGRAARARVLSHGNGEHGQTRHRGWQRVPLDRNTNWHVMSLVTVDTTRCRTMPAMLNAR